MIPFGKNINSDLKYSFIGQNTIVANINNKKLICNFQNESSISLKDNEGRIYMRGFGIEVNLYNKITHFFNSIIYKTSALESLANNNYLSDEEITLNHIKEQSLSLRQQTDQICEMAKNINKQLNQTQKQTDTAVIQLRTAVDQIKIVKDILETAKKQSSESEKQTDLANQTLKQASAQAEEAKKQSEQAKEQTKEAQKQSSYAIKQIKYAIISVFVSVLVLIVSIILPIILNKYTKTEVQIIDNQYKALIKDSTNSIKMDSSLLYLKAIANPDTTPQDVKITDEQFNSIISILKKSNAKPSETK
jgi:hypothetical protein